MPCVNTRPQSRSTHLLPSALCTTPPHSPWTARSRTLRLTSQVIGRTRAHPCSEWEDALRGCAKQANEYGGFFLRFSPIAVQEEIVDRPCTRDQPSVSYEQCNGIEVPQEEPFSVDGIQQDQHLHCNRPQLGFGEVSHEERKRIAGDVFAHGTHYGQWQ